MNGDATTTDPTPSDPEFYRRVLHFLPTPVMVFDESGTIRYANVSLCELSGYDLETGVGSNIADYIHPDDVDFALEAFGRIMSMGDSDHFEDAKRWGGVMMRLVSASGEPLPLIVGGVGGLADPHVQGIVAHLHPAWNDDQLGRVLTGLATGEPVDELMAAIIAKTVLPGVELDAAVFEVARGGISRCVAASNLAIECIGSLEPIDGSWPLGSVEPERTAVGDLPADLSSHLAAHGYHDYFEASVEAPDGLSRMVLVACSPDANQLTMSTLQRLEQSSELMAVVLMRTHHDERLTHAATHDPLTGLPNRLGLSNRFEELVVGGHSATLLFVDLDGFKAINDLHGHTVGDLVLSAVAERLRRAVRTNDQVARLGGDEFALLIQANDPLLQRSVVEAVANRVLNLLAQPILPGDLNLFISASVGIADIVDDTALDAVLGRADEAMYEAKRAGGGEFRLADQVADR